MTEETGFGQQRQEALWPRRTMLGRTVSTIGIGMTGSYVALALAKSMGQHADIKVFDADTVDSSNVVLQLYGPGDAGLLKVDALASLLERLAGVRIEAHPLMVEIEDQRDDLEDIAVVCVDSMRARKRIWQECISGNPKVRWLIDLRVGGLDYTLVTCRVADRMSALAYEDTLYSDDQSAADLTCAKGMMSTTFEAVGAVVRAVWQITTGRVPEFRIDGSMQHLDRYIEEGEDDPSMVAHDSQIREVGRGMS